MLYGVWVCSWYQQFLSLTRGHTSSNLQSWLLWCYNNQIHILISVVAKLRKKKAGFKTEFDFTTYHWNDGKILLWGYEWNERFFNTNPLSCNKDSMARMHLWIAISKNLVHLMCICTWMTLTFSFTSANTSFCCLFMETLLMQSALQSWAEWNHPSIFSPQTSTDLH